MKKTILFAAITVISVLVLSEILLRITLTPLPARPFEWPPADMTKHGLMADETLFWKLRPDYDGRWRLFKLAYTHELVSRQTIDWEARKRLVAPTYGGVTWQVNHRGFRGPLIPAEKREGTVRLLFMGSSITFGWGIRAEEAFPEAVRRELEKIYPGTLFESLNAGVPGYASYQGMRYLEIILPQYKPDVVVAEFGVNDGTLATGREDKAWQPDLLNEIRLRLKNTGWARLVLRVFPPREARAPIEDVKQTYDEAQKSFYRISMTGTRTRVSPADFKANLHRMAGLCQKHGARFVTYIPCLYNEYGEAELVASVDFGGPEVLSVDEILSAYPQDELATFFLPFDEAHLSLKGHGIVAGSLVRFLRAHMEEVFTRTMLQEKTQ
jgi:lysophospholipase L1-like esterase